MKKYILIISILIISSCKNKVNEIAGTYKSASLDFAEYLKYGTTKDMEGMDLLLNVNGSYHYDTCGILIDGNWEVKEDSLFLKVDQIRFKSDSINKIRKPEIRNDFLKYKIEGNTLLGFVNERKSIRINKLTKE